MNERFVLTPGQEEKERDSGIKVSNRRKKNPLTICEKLAKQRTTSRPFFFFLILEIYVQQVNSTTKTHGQEVPPVYLKVNGVYQRYGSWFCRALGNGFGCFWWCVVGDTGKTESVGRLAFATRHVDLMVAG